MVPSEGLSSRPAQSKTAGTARILIPRSPPSVAGIRLQREGYPVKGGGGVKFRISRTLRDRVPRNKGVVGVKGFGQPRHVPENKPPDGSARASAGSGRARPIAAARVG